MIRLYALLVGMALVLGGISGCSDNGNSKPADGAVTQPDRGGPVGDAFVPTQLQCGTDSCKEFVISKLLLPANQEQTMEFAVDFDNNGTKENNLGAILTALMQINQDLALQDSLDAALNEGQTIILFKVQGGDLVNEQQAALQAWVGKQTTCCPTAPDEPACATESQTTCFSGSHEFEIASTSPSDAIFGGSIASGKGHFGPSTLQLTLPITSAGSISLGLKQAQVKATFEGGKITGGVIAGGISEDDLNNSVLPSVATLMDNTVKDPETAPATKKQILDLFDTNEDGSISLDEVKTSVIASFLAPDVDVDGDGTLELSLGVGFEAVGAKIKTQ